MPTIKYSSPAAPETLLTTGLNSLANSSGALSAEISNDQSGELYLYADFSLTLNTQGAARQTGAVVELYILPKTDGTNYPYGASNLTPAASLRVWNFQLDAATTARVVVGRRIPLPPTDFIVLLRNVTGQAFAASGNTLTMIRYNLQTV